MNLIDSIAKLIFSSQVEACPAHEILLDRKNVETETPTRSTLAEMIYATAKTLMILFPISVLEIRSNQSARVA